MLERAGVSRQVVVDSARRSDLRIAISTPANRSYAFCDVVNVGASVSTSMTTGISRVVRFW